MNIDFVGGAYKGRSIAVDGQECINFYQEYLGVSGQAIGEYFYGTKQKAKAPQALFPTPGLVPFNVDTNIPGPVRDLYTTSTGRMFAVIGKQLVEYAKYGGKTIRGTLLTTTGRVSMADCGNGAQRGHGLCIVDGQYGYNYNLTNNSFELILDQSFPKSVSVLFMNGYFIVNEVNSERFWFSQLYNCLDWSDLDDTFTTDASITPQIGLLTVILSDSITESVVNVQLGVTYTIVTPGTTDFTLMGAPDSNIGTTFIATAAGTGTGTVSYNPLALVSIDANMYATLTSQNAYMQGFTQFFDPTTGELQISITSIGGSGSSNAWTISLYEGSTRFYSAEGTPDNLRTIATIRNELWLVGDISTEIWYNPVGADANVPFTKSRGAFINNGTVAANSVCTNGNNLFWLGSSAAGHGQIWMSNNYQPVKISTTSIDHSIESLMNIGDASGFCYTQEGHEFYVLSFTQSNKTYVYDVSTGEWHERAYWNSTEGKFERYLPEAHCVFNGINYVGDYRNGNIYSLDLNVFTDNGEIVRRVRTGPHIHQDRKRLYFREFEIDIERGGRDFL